MIPAKIMPAAVPVFTDSRPQPLHLREEFLMTEAVQILIHRILAPCHSVVTHHGADFNGGIARRLWDNQSGLFVLPDLQLQHQREPRSTEATMTVRSWHRRPRGLVSRPLDRDAIPLLAQPSLADAAALTP